jgi:ABC-2 type transport system permease protein
MAVSLLSQNKVDTSDKNIVVIDHSGLFAETLQQSIEQRNELEIFNPETHEKIRPAYHLEFVNPDVINPTQQKLELSKLVTSKDLDGFLEIGSSVLHPDTNSANAYVRYYSESAFLDETMNWFTNPINNHLRELRMADLHLSPDSTRELFYYTGIDAMGLLKMDETTGQIKDAEKSNVMVSIILPYIMVLLMFMMAIMGSMPLLSAVMEEKMEKIAEVLLAVVTPFQFMAGKILGSTAVSLTTAVIYVVGGVFIAEQFGAGDMIPYHLIPWFFIYLVLYLIMTGSFMAAFGSACNDNKDAQNAAFPAQIPLLIPIFVVMPILRNPVGPFATWLSLFPPFTPLLMIVRQATPVTIPTWQPFVGLAGVILFTALSVWVGSRIFRTGILMQGQKPTLGNIIKYALKG